MASQATTNTFQSNPTIASGDFKVSTDGAALANLGTLPAVTPASSKMVKITLSTSEMNGDNVTVVCSDAAGAEWRDLVINIQTAAQQLDDLATQASVNTVDDFLDTELAALTTAVGVIDDFLDTEVAAIKAKTDNLPTDPADASVIAADIAALNDISVTDILTAIVEGGLDIKESLRLMLAVLVGESTGGGTTSVAFRDTGDTKNRVATTVDSNGNRTAVVLDVTD